MLILRLLAWPFFIGLGFCFVVWFYDLTSSTSTWREIDEVTWISASSWLVGPALVWVLVPADLGRPSFMVWTLAAGGTAALVAALVLLGSFFYTTEPWTYMDFGANDILRMMGDFGNTSVEDAVWSPGILALYLLAPCVGYTIALGMMSRRVSLVYFLASVLGSVAAYFLYFTIAQGVGDAMLGLGWDAGLSSMLPLVFVLAAMVGLFGAIAMIAWTALDRAVWEEAQW